MRAVRGVPPGLAHPSAAAAQRRPARRWAACHVRPLRAAPAAPAPPTPPQPRATEAPGPGRLRSRAPAPRPHPPACAAPARAPRRSLRPQCSQAPRAFTTPPTVCAARAHARRARRRRPASPLQITSAGPDCQPPLIASRRQAHSWSCDVMARDTQTAKYMLKCQIIAHTRPCTSAGA